MCYLSSVSFTHEDMPIEPSLQVADKICELTTGSLKNVLHAALVVLWSVLWKVLWSVSLTRHMTIALLTLLPWFRIQKLKPHAPQSFPSPEFIALSPSPPKSSDKIV